MLIAKNGTQYNQITNEIIKAHATYVNSPFVKVNRALNYRKGELVDDFTPEELKAGLTEIAKIADVETRELYINKFFSSNRSEAQQIITQTLANKETYNKTEVNNLLNAKANQNTTYNKTEVDNRLREYSFSKTETYNRDQVNHLLSSVNQSTYSKREIDDRVNVKANWNAIVNLTGNQNINGVKTFSSPIIIPNGTANTHAVNLAQLNTKADRNYVKKRGGFVNVNFNLSGGQGILIDLNLGINFNVIVQSGVSANMRVINAASNIGQSGEIYVSNGAGVSSFSAPFNFRVAQSGFGANEVFSYLVVNANLVRITRS